MRAPETKQSNAERFNLLIGKIQEKLLESCPVPIELPSSAFGMESGNYDGLHYFRSSDEVFLEATLQWLAAEGFIRGNNDEYVITHKGLELCGGLPNRLK